MRRRFFEIAFTPAVQALQSRHGSRELYARVADATPVDAGLSPRETAFLAARDSFYLATTSETGWPYIQHRGGPAGFVRVLDARTIGWADFAGNRQYVSLGNAAADDRVALFFMDYAHQRRLKLLGRMTAYDAVERPDLIEQLRVPGYPGKVERAVLVAVEAFDWNCPQHIVPRFTLAEIEAAAAGIAWPPAPLLTSRRPRADRAASAWPCRDAPRGHRRLRPPLPP